MKKIMTDVLTKFPHPLLRVDKNSGKPATELDRYTSSNTISCNGIGKNFENVPQEANIFSRGTERIDYDFISKEAVVSVSINGTLTSKMRDMHEFNTNVDNATKALNKTNIQDDIIVCVLITVHSPRGKHKYIMMLSEPMTIETIAKKRLSVIQGKRDEELNCKLNAIATMWE